MNFVQTPTGSRAHLENPGNPKLTRCQVEWTSRVDLSSAETYGICARCTDQFVKTPAYRSLRSVMQEIEQRAGVWV